AQAQNLQQAQAQTVVPTRPGWRGVMDRLVAASPFSPASQLKRINEKRKDDPQFQGWSSGVKTTPMLPTIAEMMPEQDNPVSSANAFASTAPQIEQYANPLDWAGAYAANQKYAAYNQNPVETDFY